MQRQAILRGFAMLIGLFAALKALVMIPQAFRTVTNGYIFEVDEYLHGLLPWAALLGLLLLAIYVLIAVRLLGKPPRAMVSGAEEDGARGFAEGVTRQIGLFAFLLTSGLIVPYIVNWGGEPFAWSALLSVPFPLFLAVIIGMIFGRPRRLVEAVCQGSQDDSLGRESVLRLLFLLGGMVLLSQLVGYLPRYSDVFGPASHSSFRAERAYALLCMLLAMAVSSYLICGAPALARWLFPKEQEASPGEEPKGLE